jgi:hypothetical protein
MKRTLDVDLQAQHVFSSAIHVMGRRFEQGWRYYYRMTDVMDTPPYFKMSVELRRSGCPTELFISTASCPGVSYWKSHDIARIDCKKLELVKARA